jgi:hypothetical protein
MLRTLNTFNRLSIPQFRNAVEAIVEGMTGNAHFTTLQTKVDALSTETTNFNALMTKALSRDKQTIVFRDASRKKITAMLRSLGYSVSAIADGDESILVTSGYPLLQPKKPTPPLVKPGTIKLATGTNSGQIDCKIDGQAGLRAVNYYITSDSALGAAEGTNGWTVFSFNKTKFTFSNLIPGQRYYIRVGLVGVKGQEVLSEVVTFFAQ